LRDIQGVTVSSLDVNPEHASLPDAATQKDREEYRGWRFWLTRIAAAVVVPVVFLVLVEGALRFFNVGFPTELTQPCTVHGRPASCYNLFFPAPYFPPGMIKSPQAYAVPVEKSANTYRIFVLGESAAMGDPDPAYAFSRYLEVMLQKQFPDRKFEIYNTGSVAINSHVLLPMARDLAKLKPDLFIIYSGNNEVVGPYGPGTALTASSMSLPIIRANIFARSTRIGELLTKVGTQKKEWGGMEMFLGKQIPATSPLMPPTYSNFESNLRDTIEVARDSGANVIVSTVATNLRDCAPFASQHREGLTPQSLQQWQDLVQQASALESAGSYEQALKLYESAAAIDGEYAELQFRIARCLLKLDRQAEARQHFEQARDLDTLRFRSDSRINEVNRSVAKSIPGTQLVDAAAVFAEHSTNGVTGDELVYEHVHLTPDGNYLLARSIFLSIAPQLAGHPVPEADVASQRECESLLALTGYNRKLMAEDMLQRLQRAPFTNQLNHSNQLLRMSIEAEAPIESPDDVAREYQWALQQRPQDRILHYNFGLFLYNFDRQAGAEQLKLAQPWDGFPVFTPDGMQIQ
jgi:tetratricopeptide (TPR) repeat protein